MNYFKIFFRIYIISQALVLVSCDDYLSTLPDNRATIDSGKKVKDLLVKAYPESNYHLMTSIMSDNARDKNTSSTREIEIDMYQWKDNTLDDRDTPTHYWNHSYKAIAQANQALASIEEMGGGEDLNPQKGEALLCRAYAHFMLVNLFGKCYDPSTASSDLGVPYVTKPENKLIVKYKRATVKKVYDNIEKDLKEGLPLVTNDYEQPKFHFTKAAANAFAARFYLYKGDWDKVIAHADKCFTTDPQLEIRDISKYRGKTYSEQRLRYISSVDEPSNLLLVSTSSMWARRFATTRFGLSVAKLSELEAITNPHGKGWLYRRVLFGRSTSYNMPKYREYFRYTNREAGIGLPFVTIVLLDKDEVLLNRAEAYVMKKQYDKAVADLDDFLAKKTYNYDAGTDKLTEAEISSNFSVDSGELSPHYTLTDKQAKFVKGILEFKRWEYYHEGLRWFDVKRFKIKVTHPFKDKADLVLDKNDLRRQLQIPQAATARGVKSNPR